MSAESLREEDERLLSGASLPLTGKDQNPPTVRRLSKCTSLVLMILLCNISILVLVGFTFYNWTREQIQILPGSDDHHDAIEATIPPAPAPTTPEVTEISETLKTSTSITSSTSTAPTAVASTSTTPVVVVSATPVPKPASQIPPSSHFDLNSKDFLASSANRTIREYTFNITRDTGRPDGYHKPVILINGQSPGPLIEANTGDTIRVQVTNSMKDDKTTVHWHGVDQRGSAWMDGLFGVTQCGIPPGQSFTYEFKLPGQRGTFWYHSHVTGQYTDGLYGPLIIHDPDEKIPDVAEDKIIMIGDLYYKSEKVLLDEYLGVGQEGRGMVGMEPSPDNILINGRHVSKCSGSKWGSSLISAPEGSGDQGLVGLTLEKCSEGSMFATRIQKGQQARLRIISHSSNLPLWFTLDSHTLQIVEIDGVEVEPIATTRIYINPGQRYSVVVSANQQAGNYRMRATVQQGCAMTRMNENIRSVDYEAVGILSYAEADITADPIGKQWDLDSSSSPDVAKEPWDRKCQDFRFDLAKPMRKQEPFVASEANQNQVRFEMRSDGNALKTFIDNVVYSPMMESAVMWEMTSKKERDENASWYFGQGKHVVVLPDEDSSAQIAISALNMMTHPWHLHGQTFQIVGWGDGEFGSGTTTWNTDNPMRRDTVTVPGNSHVVIRIKADNPGLWALHCHIQWHAEGGMFTVVGERLNTLEQQVASLDSGDLHGKYCSAQ